MAKSDRDHATQLLEMAIRDLTALENMLDDRAFSEEVFGFHAQQGIEKALKAWISVLRLPYPKTHDLSVLIGILGEKTGTVPAQFHNLEDYTVYAVQYRYETYDREEELLDRPKVIAEVSALVERVRGIIAGLPI